MMATLFLLVGYTAVGKTELSLRLAEALDAEILSCDSVQVYRGMDIGSAKVSKLDRSRINHHGIDLVDVCDQFNIQRYIDYASRVTEAVIRKGKNLLIVGGSGFYLKSFYGPILDDVVISDELKAQVQSLYDNCGLVGLVNRIRELSGDSLAGLDLKNPRRVIKALERCLATGTTLEQNIARSEHWPWAFSNYKRATVLLKRNSGHELVRNRVIKMIEDGLVDEVKHLIKVGIENNRSAANAIGYRETISFIKNGCIDCENLINDIVKNTNNLVKKQRTWFKKQIPIDLEVCLDDYYVDESFDLVYMFFKKSVI
ncbi:MAG: tRNA (adenosine(37)-N6)-dimethylallyltransferase MiaA [Puniceicoccales bacterium]|jgi:tRNA dimethylallyltransferase|nr:tRNA (adenosine(37)-N6)-dimethylallyltransferase MiaA [Puniceicoccales bacterium]